MNKVIATILAFTLSGQVVAEECQAPVTAIQVGAVANCAGFLFSPSKEAEVRFKVLDYGLLLEQSKLYLQQKDLYQKAAKTSEEIATKEATKAELWRTRAEESTQKLTETQERQSTRDSVFFGLGLFTSILTVFALHNVTK